MVLTHIDLKYVSFLYRKIRQKVPNGKGLNNILHIHLPRVDHELHRYMNSSIPHLLLHDEVMLHRFRMVTILTILWMALFSWVQISWIEQKSHICGFQNLWP